MLLALARHIGEDHHHLSTAETLRADGFSDRPAFDALIAEQQSAPVGLSLFFPMYSTTHGASGVYVQDLWVSTELRGVGLGRQLLATTAKHAAEAWNATFLKLAVYNGDTAAVAFYQRVGLKAGDGELPLAAIGEEFQRIRDSA